MMTGGVTHSGHMSVISGFEAREQRDTGAPCHRPTAPPHRDAREGSNRAVTDTRTHTLTGTDTVRGQTLYSCPHSSPVLPARGAVTCGAVKSGSVHYRTRPRLSCSWSCFSENVDRNCEQL